MAKCGCFPTKEKPDADPNRSHPPPPPRLWLVGAHRRQVPPGPAEAEGGAAVEDEEIHRAPLVQGALRGSGRRGAAAGSKGGVS